MVTVARVFLEVVLAVPLVYISYELLAFFPPIERRRIDRHLDRVRRQSADAPRPSSDYPPDWDEIPIVIDGEFAEQFPERSAA